jgi:hypothetical protein
MAKKWGPMMAAVVVTAVVLQADHESPGAGARGAASLRDTVTPIVSEMVGGAGDAVLVVRDEAERQGLNPGAVLSGPSVADEPNMNPRDVTELPPLEGEEQGGN